MENQTNASSRYFWNMRMPKIPKYLRSKYSIATFVFVMWMLFFHDIDIPFMIETRSELHQLEEQREWYGEENKKAKEALRDLTTNQETLEKFAREEYFMKRDNEDVYVIREEQD